MGFRNWPGWQRLDELDRRSGFGADGWWHRPWAGVVLVVGIVGLLFLKALIVGGSSIEAIATVALFVGMGAVAVLGGFAVDRWRSR